MHLQVHCMGAVVPPKMAKSIKTLAACMHMYMYNVHVHVHVARMCKEVPFGLLGAPKWKYYFEALHHGLLAT